MYLFFPVILKQLFYFLDTICSQVFLKIDRPHGQNIEAVQQGFLWEPIKLNITNFRLIIQTELITTCT